MRPPVALASLLLTVAVVAGLATAYTNTSPLALPAVVVEPGKSRVKLAVLVVFDQLRGDYLEKWRGLFGKDGFARLQNEGVWFTHCYYPYGITSTGPGHASMLTGTCPDRHGIVNNNWFERGEDVYCAGSPRYTIVPTPPPAKPDPKAKPDAKVKAPSGGTPERLLAETVADVLKATHPKAKVFGLSLKDRSAILPTGKRPDGAYWFDGRFVTSTYYEQLHPWVAAFNKSGSADRWFGRDWTRFRTDIDYEKWSGPDDVPGEGGSRVFPHQMTGGKATPGKEYYDTLANSPFGNDLLLEFTKKCVLAENLGADDVPDLLVVSFSSNDLIGHTWGPDSQEVLDATLRSNAQMAELLAFLDTNVGRGQYLMGVTADHGICPLVEVSETRGIDAKRISPAAIQKDLEYHLTTKFGSAGGISLVPTKQTAWIESLVFPWVYFNPKLLAATGKSRGEVAAATTAYLRSRSDVARAFTRIDLAANFPADDIVANRVKRSVWEAPTQAAERCGDVYIVQRPYYLPSKPIDTGTTHGSPYNYDTHVPLLFYGPGITGGANSEPTTPQATAAVFSKWLGLRLPNRAEFPVPVALEGK